MLKGLWSKGYMKAIHEFDDGDEYPVAGYHEVLDEVYKRIRESGAKRVLDLGFGTGIVTKRLYQDGVEIYGVDMSESMVEAAREDMPDAHLLCEDFELGIPSEFLGVKFDAAIATYSVYNIDDVEKRELMDEVLHQLNPGGMAIVGGIAFESKDAKKACMKANKDLNFKCVFPMVKTEILRDYPHAKWTQVSKCAAILEIARP